VVERAVKFNFAPHRKISRSGTGFRWCIARTKTYICEENRKKKF